MKFLFLLSLLCFFLSTAYAQTPKSVWVWSNEKLEVKNFLADLKENSIGTVYLDPGAFLYDEKARQHVQTLIRELKKSQISVELLIGNAEWVKPESQNKALDLSKKYLELIKKLPPSDRPTAIHYDIEPQALPEWNTNKDATVESYFKLIEKLTELVHNSGLKISVDVGFYYDSLKVLSKGRALSELLLDLVDTYAIMAYRDQVGGENGIVALCKQEMAYEKKMGLKKIYIGVETGKTSEGSFITFHEEGKDALKKALKELESMNLDGIAIHHYESWKDLK